MLGGLFNKRRPVVGITSNFDAEGNYSHVKHGYYSAVIECGGIPLLIPVNSNMEYLTGVVDSIDALILTGGADVDPIHFGEEILPCNGNISPERDEMELILTKLIIEAKKPVLGICRGMQLINIALGGTLYQDIRTQVTDTNLLQHEQKAPVWYQSHMVEIEESSILHQSYDTTQYRVNSFHHQAVKDVADGLKASAWTSDGIIEAIEGNEGSFILAVQWHPETMWQKDSKHLAVFRALIKEARK